ncbi:MAG: hypothetical protein LWW80_05550 [Thiomonas sp.]|nr:hypothetical protein [Thiomonas sp.]
MFTVPSCSAFNLELALSTSAGASVCVRQASGVAHDALLRDCLRLALPSEPVRD